jgi:iron(III) transport system ATP-binding protein
MLEAVDVRKTFSGRAEDVRALDRVSLTVRAGSLFTLLGASGCGKTTMLRSIAGLERPEAGQIRIDDVVVLDGERGVFVPPNKRKLGMVFQSYAIWPHMTVFENVAYPLKVRGVRRREIARAVGQALETVQMSHLRDRSATMLSGGQQQRLALARATIGSPRLLLLDEPLSNLDAKLREHMRFELKRLQRDLGITTVYVTHDQAEALALSDEIAVMHEGRIVQRGTPREVYESPATAYVADFIGSANVLPAVIRESAGSGRESVVEIEGVTCRGMLRTDGSRGSAAMVAVRPESIGLRRADGSVNGAVNVLPGVVKSSVFGGDSTDVLVECGSVDVRVRVQLGDAGIAPGDQVRLTFPPDGCLIFGQDT